MHHHAGDEQLSQGGNANPNIASKSATYTWNDLAANQDIQSALSAKQATTTELLAAAYNSNAAKLPGYIRRAGSGWRALIPRETQIYLQIYQSLETLMRAKENHARKKIR